MANGYADAAAQQLAKARELAKRAPPEDAELVKQALNDAQNASKRAAAAKKAVAAAIKLLPQNPPIDSIAHQVQFVVATNVNITPSWTLVRFKGPGVTGTFAAASRSVTHTLNIAMGAPEAGIAGPDQIRQLINLRIDSLSQSIKQQLNQ